ncbi:MAG: response regulator [Bacillota bacterium]|nr:response regulator [Bacillota bacterium]MDI7248769.1 response regulator [Bacillota bacterium]
MARTIRVLVVEQAEAPEGSLRALLEGLEGVEVVGTAADGSRAVESARRAAADVVILDLGLRSPDGPEVARALQQEAGSAVVAISAGPSPEEFRRVVRAGVRDYLIRPFGREDLLEAIRTAANGHGNGTGSGLVPEATTVVFLSARGGVGKTTLAVNLACWLAARSYRTVLADLDLEFGTAAVLMGVRPRSTVVDLCRGGEVTREGLTAVLTAAGPGTPSLLACPPEPHLAAEVDGEGRGEPGRCYVGDIIAGLRHLCDYLVVDTQTCFREATLAVLDGASVVMLVTTPDIPALYQTGRVLDLLLDRLGYPAEKVRLIVNRYEHGRHLSPEEIARGLDHPVSCVIPADAVTVSEAADRGEPFVLKEGWSGVHRAIARLGRVLLGEAGPPGEESDRGTAPEGGGEGVAGEAAAEGMAGEDAAGLSDAGEGPEAVLAGTAKSARVGRASGGGAAYPTRSRQSGAAPLSALNYFRRQAPRKKRRGDKHGVVSEGGRKIGANRDGVR